MEEKQNCQRCFIRNMVTQQELDMARSRYCNGGSIIITKTDCYEEELTFQNSHNGEDLSTFRGGFRVPAGFRKCNISDFCLLKENHGIIRYYSIEFGIRPYQYLRVEIGTS